ncbi:MAG: 50S ribosomal protein L3 [Candidatus Auribacterota bacterium]|nr:50S ribosomal protein L3 [Candidatus Auribacterota bacterium]
MSIILLGRKKGMTRIFDAKGEVIPVSVVEIKPGTVLDKKTQEKHQYTALQVGFEDRKEKLLKKPQKVFFAKMNQSPKRYIRESRVSQEILDSYSAGDAVGLTVFEKGEFVDVSAKSIGKGFAGVMKRWNYRGGRDSHGSMFHRAPGSIGASADPSRVFKGTGLPGRMGGKRATVQNIEIVDVRESDNIVLLKGGIPGPRGGVVEIRKAKKK